MALGPLATECAQLTGCQRDSLELVSKPSQADEDAGEVDKALVDEAIVFVADLQAAEAADPRDGAFDLPAAAVAPELFGRLAWAVGLDRGDAGRLGPSLCLRSSLAVCRYRRLGQRSGTSALGRSGRPRGLLRPA